MKTLDNIISTILNDTNYSENPYFLNLANGSFDKQDFTETQIQFYFAVIFFSRPMSALAAKIPSPELRIEILRNAWEEHGEGSLVHGHGNTFLKFLLKLNDIEFKQVDNRELWPEVRIFNTALTGVTVLDDYLVGIATLGIIERMFSDISSWIGRSVVKNNWISESDMVHYNLHSELDIKHSQDFFDILKKPYSQSPENKYNIEQGLRLGSTLFNNLFYGLWHSRKTRRNLNNEIHPMNKYGYFQ